MKLVTTEDRVKIEGDFPVELSLVPLAPFSSFIRDVPKLIFNIEALAGTGHELKITLKYDRSGGQTAFLAFLASPSLGPNTLYQVTVFGEVVESTFPSFNTRKTAQSVYLISRDLSQDLVEIEIRGQIAQTSSLSFALEGESNVVNAGVCASTCPEKPDFETGLLARSTPPICIFCDTSLFLEFYHLSAICRCLPKYYTDQNGDCQPCADPLCSTCRTFGTRC